jgi:hypothetical protein
VEWTERLSILERGEEWSGLIVCQFSNVVEMSSNSIVSSTFVDAREADPASRRAGSQGRAVGRTFWPKNKKIKKNKKFKKKQKKNVKLSYFILPTA